MREMISVGVWLMVCLSLAFSGCGKRESNPEGGKADAAEQRGVSEATGQAEGGAMKPGVETAQPEAGEMESEVETEEGAAEVGEEIDEALMDPEVPQEDFVDENSEPEATQSREEAAEKGNELRKFLNFDEALRAAKANGKPILLDFTGSDWCPPCMKMEREAIGTDRFASYSNEKLNFVYLDFPRRRKLEQAQAQHNSAIAERYNIESFPTLVLLNSKGEELDRMVGYRSGGAQALINWIERSQAR